MKAFFKHFSFIAIYFILCQFTPIFLYIKYKSLMGINFFIMGLICASIGVLMYYKDLKLYIKPLFDKWYNLPFILVIWIIFLLIGAILAALIGINTTENQENINQLMKNLPIPILILTLAIIYPFIEELIFRHILIGKLSHIIPTSLATIISCLLFAGVHAGSNWESLAVYLPLSVGITIAYFLTKGRMLGSYFYHFVQNLLSALVMILLQN